jgi:hypothetical protein
VGVTVGVGVEVRVGVAVDVGVDVKVGVGVRVGTRVGVGVSVGIMAAAIDCGTPDKTATAMHNTMKASMAVATISALGRQGGSGVETRVSDSPAFCVACWRDMWAR